MLDQRRDSGPCRDHAEMIAERYLLGPALRRSADCCAHRAYDELLQRTVRVTLVRAATADTASFSLRPQGWQDRDPEVAEIFDAGRDHDRLFLVTHHPDEPTLAETTPPSGLDLRQLRDLGTAVATALVPRHERGAAHGGLGAGTVAFTPQGASLAEFGLLPWLARWGDVPVAPPYLAPEQRDGADPGPASDVYALGRLLAELAPDHGLRPGLRALFADMTAESPSARPSMAEVRRRLAGRAGRPAAGGGRRRVGQRVGLAAAACCLVGLGIGLSALAGETPAVGSDGATLSATAGVPAPLVPLAPAPLVAGPSAAVAVASTAEDSSTAADRTATAVTAAARRSSGGDAGTPTASAASPRVTGPRTSTPSRDGDSAARPTRSTTPDPDQQATPVRPTTTTRPDATGSGQQLRGVLDGAGHAPGRSGHGDDAGRAGTDHGSTTTGGHDDPPTTSRPVLDPDQEDPS